MPLSWNEIKQRAIKFSKEWENESKENAEAKSFWDSFFDVFGISRRRIASFEEPVKKLGEKSGFIDLFWKGNLIVEHKSRGRDLDRAYTQAMDYFPGIKEEELPKYILVSDFERLRLYDLDEATQHEFLISELHQNIKLFGFIAGYQKIKFREEDPINIYAAEKMGKLYDMLKDNGYERHELEIYLVRLLFMLFADDTGIFEKDIFWDYIENHTSPDGSDLALKLAQLFQVLNTPADKRLRNLDELFNQFPYINGKLFEEVLSFAAFDSGMRRLLMESCSLDWGKISPAIFGSLFQSIMDKAARRNLGAHYTSEKNIMKVIKPLFLDELWEEFNKVKDNSNKLREFHKQLSKLKFLDPACGSGNFLIIAYRELRLLELAILEVLYKQEIVTNIENIVWVNIDQFYGIEIDEWAARIAEVAMWLIDHQMNMLISEKFGNYYVRIPLITSANILHANSLQTDWEELVPREELSYILGNPPFIGYKLQTPEQKIHLNRITNSISGGGVLDFVTGWYLKAAQYIQGTTIKVAFVSTNSISQGEQVGILWNELLSKYKIKIHFAHRTFRWDNEAKSQAAVHVVIVGFANFDIANKRIFDYENIKTDAHEIKVQNINPYLIEGNNILIEKRRTPISKVPNMDYGSEPREGGFLILSNEEKKQFSEKYPFLTKYIKRFVSADDYINNKYRWCFWLVGAESNLIRKSKELLERLEDVRIFRQNSLQKQAIKTAETPSLFTSIRQPNTNYLIIPIVSSENRKYIPIGYLQPEVIASNASFTIPNATLYLFGVLTSEMHMSWVKYTCGRLESRFRYSNTIVYNNYPFPLEVSAQQKERVEQAAQKVLDTRLKYPDSSLADLYDPLAMPADLVKAHRELDRAVDLCYRSQPFTNERTRIEFLFELYSQYTAPLSAQMIKKKRGKRD